MHSTSWPAEGRLPRSAAAATVIIASIFTLTGCAQLLNPSADQDTAACKRLVAVYADMDVAVDNGDTALVAATLQELQDIGVDTATDFGSDVTELYAGNRKILAGDTSNVSEELGDSIRARCAELGVGLPTVG
ncbi:hypothetical protein [Agromyces humi]|uniref:hypothetical protein n=1 Tax=Agromyces humi TaxID=1766800 RepID=UPI0013596AA4|nr:hypothetical protein [Agromyces humi]